MERRKGKTFSFVMCWPSLQDVRCLVLLKEVTSLEESINETNFVLIYFRNPGMVFWGAKDYECPNYKPYTSECAKDIENIFPTEGVRQPTANWQRDQGAGLRASKYKRCVLASHLGWNPFREHCTDCWKSDSLK
jgi:hypothetical protein